ncbi:glycosyltransferase family 2 protein [Archangium minus]
MSEPTGSNMGVRGRVSVVIPTKDRLPLLTEALESLQRQGYADWEAIVVDDGSRDGTLARLREWEAADPRIRCVVREGEPTGGNRCRNLGFAASTGEYLVFLDDDDAFSPNCLQERVRRMEARPELDFGVFPHQHFLERPGDMQRVWPAEPDRDDIERYLRVDIPWQTAGAIWRRKALVALGPWDEALPCWQDWDFYMRALARGARYQCFPDGPCFFHRVQTSARVAVSVKKRGPAQLRGVERAVASGQRYLEENGGLTSRRRLLLARLHLSVGEQLREQGLREESFAVWRRCRERRLVSEAQYREGQLFLTVWRTRLARGALRRYLALRWRE